MLQISLVVEIGFVSGSTDIFKRINLYNVLTSVRGTENTDTGSSKSVIGRAKSRGFEYVTGAVNNTFASSSLTSAIYKHYLFDINMFTHINTINGNTFTTSETITGSTSGATALQKVNHKQLVLLNAFQLLVLVL